MSESVLKNVGRIHSLIIYNAKEIKPPIGLRVIVCGGSAYWTGKCWRSIMDPPHSGDYYEIQWEVMWWAEFPKFTHFTFSHIYAKSQCGAGLSMNNHKTFIEIGEDFRKAFWELFNEIAKALRLEAICDFLERIFKGGKK